MKAKSNERSPRNNELPLRVLLVDETFERAALLKHALLEAGYRIAAHVSSSTDIAGLVNEIKPDMIILYTESPDRDTLEHLCLISRDQPRPIVMFTHDDDSEKITAAIRAGVSAYVVAETSSTVVMVTHDVDEAPCVRIVVAPI